jgi:hypothetical protein
MTPSVFISYNRDVSQAHAGALKAKFGDEAFLDTQAQRDGEPFPPRLLQGLLDSRVVVVFASKAYSESRYCRLEMRIALAAASRGMPHLVLARDDGYGAVLDAQTSPASPLPRRRRPACSFFQASVA